MNDSVFGKTIENMCKVHWNEVDKHKQKQTWIIIPNLILKTHYLLVVYIWLDSIYKQYNKPIYVGCGIYSFVKADNDENQLRCNLK